MMDVGGGVEWWRRVQWGGGVEEVGGVGGGGTGGGLTARHSNYCTRARAAVVECVWVVMLMWVSTS